MKHKPHNKSVDEIDRMWQQFLKMPFPRGCGGQDVAGVCLATVDLFAAGCIDTFLAWRGELNQERIEVLNSCVDDLEIAVPLLEGQARVYFDQLLKLSRKVLQSIT